jgi:hypothetical protein
MAIQPGVGFSFTSSGYGTTLDINPVWSSLISVTPSNFVPNGGGEVIVDTGNNFLFSKMRVICRSANNSYLSCLREYNLVGMAVYPTGSKTAPTIANTTLIDEGATFTLVPPVAPATTKEYVFSVILNHYNIASGTLSAGVPYAALMEVGGDAYIKTTPGFDESGCDKQTWVNTFQYTPVTIEIPVDPFEINGNLEIGQVDKVQQYNCQRLRIATIYWNSATSKWVVTQHLQGPITIPFNIFYAGPYRWEDTDTFVPPTWFTSPDFEPQQLDWEGNYTGSTKWSGGANPTESITI